MHKRISENIASRRSINHRIERQLKAFNPTEQMRLLDALEAVRDSGPDGITPKAWAERLKSLYPDDEFNVVELMKLAVRRFPFVIKRTGEGVYGWSEEDRDVAQPPPEVAAAMRGQVQLAGMAMQIMKSLGEFTSGDLVQGIADVTGMEPEQAEVYAEHFIGQFLGGLVQQIGPDRFKVVEEPKASTDDTVQRLLRNAGLRPRD